MPEATATGLGSILRQGLSPSDPSGAGFEGGGATATGARRGSKSLGLHRKNKNTKKKSRVRPNASAEGGTGWKCRATGGVDAQRGDTLKRKIRVALLPGPRATVPHGHYGVGSKLGS